MSERHLALYHKASDTMIASVWATAVERRKSGGWLLLNDGNLIAATGDECIVRDADTREEIGEPLAPLADTKEGYV